jgi:hypothetical protein
MLTEGSLTVGLTAGVTAGVAAGLGVPEPERLKKFNIMPPIYQQRTFSVR